MSGEKINTIIEELEAIVEACVRQHNPQGLFAALYLKVTRQIRDGIQQQQFEDNARMEHFDVVFARRYIDAYQAYTSAAPVSASWEVALDKSKNGNILAIQHLLLGMNAHINLDLGIVAAQISQGTALDNLEADFNKINDILLQLLEEVQIGINSISPALWLVDWLFSQRDEQFAGFSMHAARAYAWKCAQLLHSTPAAQLPEQITLLDHVAATMGRELIRPRRILHWLIALVRRFEDQDVAAQIKRMGA